MNGATLILPTTSLDARADQLGRGPRTTVRGGVVLMLVWTVLAGAFLFDVARPPDAGAWKSTATTQAVALALARSSPPPCSP